LVHSFSGLIWRGRVLDLLSVLCLVILLGVSGIGIGILGWMGPDGPLLERGVVFALVPEKKKKETSGEEEEELSSGETSHVLMHHPVSLLSGGA
jgi:hypothetical protein